MIDSVKTKEVDGTHWSQKKHSLSNVHLALSSGSLDIRYGYSQKRFRCGITFNPSKLDDQSKLEIEIYLKSLFHNGWESLVERATLNRLDVAVDVVGKSHGDYLYVYQRLRTGFGKLIDKGTTYVGSRRSTREMGIYDKRKELFEVHKIDVGHELLRVEARVCRPSKYGLKEIGEVKNPFASLLVVDRVLAAKMNKVLVKELLARVDAGASANQAYWDLPLFKRKILSELLRKAAPSWWSPRRHGISTRKA